MQMAEVIAYVYRDKDQRRQVYINEFDDEELDRLEAEGYLFFAEYASGRYRRVNRSQVVNPNPSYTGTIQLFQKQEEAE